MRIGHQKTGTADAARSRLLEDQALRPIAEQRAQLEILAARLERAGRGAIMQSLAARVRTDRRFAPLFGKLVQISLNS
jgi:hypothetical protein